MIEYQCPKCGEPMESPSSLADSRERCPKCGGWVRVPLASSTSSAPVRPKSALATASLICGVCALAWPTSALVLAGIVAIVLGIVALRKTKRAPSAYGGAGRARGGIFCGAIGLVLGTVISIWMGRPRMAVRELMSCYPSTPVTAENGEFRMDLPLGCRLASQPDAVPSAGKAPGSFVAYQATTLDGALAFVVCAWDFAGNTQPEHEAEVMLRAFLSDMNVKDARSIEHTTYHGWAAVRGNGTARFEGHDLQVEAEVRLRGDKAYTLAVLSDPSVPVARKGEAICRFFSSFEVLAK